MGGTTSEHKTDYGMAWVVLAVLFLTLTFVGAWAWLFLKTRRVAPKRIWAVWVLLGLSGLLLGAWAWVGVAGSRAPWIAVGIAERWREWLPDLICVYAVACVTVAIVERDQAEPTYRRLPPMLLRLRVWLGAVIAATLLMSAWAALSSGTYAFRPGAAGQVLAPVLSLDPNFITLRLARAETFLVLLMTVIALLALTRIRTRTRSAWWSGMAVLLLAGTAGAIDSVLVRPIELLAFLMHSAAAAQLWRARHWFFRR